MLEYIGAAFHSMVMDRQRSGCFSEVGIAMARNLLIFFDASGISSKIGVADSRIGKLKA
jgi:hypothetical protein